MKTKSKSVLERVHEMIAAFRRRDARTKCQRCGRWMRFTPTVKTPATRRPAPNAGHCTECRP